MYNSSLHAFVFFFEAFVAALYVDKGLRHVEVFCRVCLFPRLEVKTTFDYLVSISGFHAIGMTMRAMITKSIGQDPTIR